MPFTPFHFGPGLLAKSLAPRWFSFTAFVLTQVVIDVETLVFLIRREWPVHRAAHTFLFGSVIGLAVGIIVFAAARALGRRTAGVAPVLGAEIGLLGALVGGLVGGASHALLDGFMHADILPLRPFGDANPLRGVVAVGALHAACVVCGIVAVPLLWLRRGVWRTPR